METEEAGEEEVQDESSSDSVFNQDAWETVKPAPKPTPRTPKAPKAPKPRKETVFWKKVEEKLGGLFAGVDQIYENIDE